MSGQWTVESLIFYTLTDENWSCFGRTIAMNNKNRESVMERVTATPNSLSIKKR